MNQPGKHIFLIFWLISTMMACNDKTSSADPAILSHESESASMYSKNNATGSNFLVVSDIHLNTLAQKVKYGEDTGTTLWDKTRDKLSTILTSTAPPDFVLYLGDLPAHKNWNNPAPPGTHEKNLDSVLTDLRTLMEVAPSIPLLYLPGNNDAIWGDYCEFSNLPTELPPFTLDQGHAMNWPVINDNPLPSNTPPYVINATHRDKGYYSAYPLDNKKLRVIALNTVIFSTNDCANASHSWSNRKADADTMLQFLNVQLKDASAQNEKIIIAMHIPPGLDSYCQSTTPGCPAKSPSPMWNVSTTINGQSFQDIFLQSIAPFKNDIVGIFTSHTHMDEIRILTYQKDTIGMAISAPGISPNHSQNPGFKTVSYDKGGSFELTDFKTFYTTLDEVQVQGKWGSDSYTFRSSYDCKKCPGTVSMLDCIKCLTPSDAYAGMSQTYLVKRGNVCCDLSPIMLVEEGQ